MSEPDHPPDPHPEREVVVVVDVANVMGSRPDGWWRDRAGAAQRLLADLAPLAGRTVPGPDGVRLQVRTVVAVLEGRSREAADPQAAGLTVLRADRDGDTAIADWTATRPEDEDVRLVASPACALAAAATATLLSGEFRISWVFLLVDLGLVAGAAVLGHLAAGRLVRLRRLASRAA